MFISGQPAGPGRPKGSVGGRARALMLLDAIVAEDEFQQLIGDAIRANIRADPMKFFRQIIMPLLPQDVRLKLGEEGAIQWVSLLDTIRTQRRNESTLIEATDSAPSVAGGGGEKPALPPPN